MKLRVLGPNQTEVEADGAIVLFSYNTPVAAQIGSDFFVTDKKFSTTTTKHINTWLAGKKPARKDQSFFDTIYTAQAGKGGAR